MPLSLVFAFLFTTCGARPQDAVARRPLLARVDGVDVPLAEYRDWMLQTHGWRFVDDYLSLVLLHRKARELGVAPPTPAELDAACADDWRDQVLLRHGGDESRLIAELKEGGIDPASYRARRFAAVERSVLARRVVLKTRSPTEEDLRRLHAREFGEDGVRRHLKVAFFDKLKDLPVGQKPFRELLQKLEDRALERAAAFAEQVGAAPDTFSDRARAADLLTVERHDGGLIDLRTQGSDVPRLREDHFGGALEEALRAAAASGELRAGALLGPLRTARGFYVLSVVACEPAPFDAVRDELRAIAIALPPSAGEIEALCARLLEQAVIEKHFPAH